MKRAAGVILTFLLVLPIQARDQSRESKRLEACGHVLKEILDIPDGIPKSLLNKAECVIVIPSVLKFAIGVGGSFGRGAITCRTGEHFTGPWSAPALFALEGGEYWIPVGRTSDRFCPPGDEPERGKLYPRQQSQTRCRCLCCGRAKRTRRGGGHGHCDEGRGT
jgi:SH3 domain-containing YSC84-like protein 1